MVENRKHLVRIGNRNRKLIGHKVWKIVDLLTVQRGGDSFQWVGRASKGARGRPQR
jgi:hypothetical protein